MTNPPLVRSLCLAISLLVTVPVNAAHPTVTNVRAAQKTGTKQVEISYDLSGSTSPVHVSLQISSNGGTTFAVPANTLSGAVGAGVSLGTNKTITWNAGADWNNQLSNTVKFRVTATGSLPSYYLPPYTYSDTTGDIDPGVGVHPLLDITSVDVSVDVTKTLIKFRINLAGSPLDFPNGTNWGKYLVAIRSGAGGATSGTGGATSGTGWGRPINFAPGMTHWIGTWVDVGGDACDGATSSYTVTSWNHTSVPTVTKDETGITIVETVANLALGPGEVFSFDVYTSGGGNPDSAVDALSASAASITGWAGPYTTNAVGAVTNAALQFTMPAP